MMQRKHVALILLVLMIVGCNTETKRSDTEDGDVVSTSVSIPSPPEHIIHEADEPGTPPTIVLSPAKELEITQGSVVDSKKHVIVNAANQWLAPGGALSGAIFSAAESSGGNAMALSAGTAFFSLVTRPYIEINQGNGQTKGFAAALGSLRVMGLSSLDNSQQITHAMTGHTFNQSLFVGAALEYGSKQKNLTHYVWKIHAMCPVFKGINIGGSFGYMVENTDINLSNNIRYFLNQLGYSKCDFWRSSPMMEGVVQININAVNQCGLVAEMCVRSFFYEHVKSKAMGRLTWNTHNLKMSGFVASDEFGFNIA